MARRLIALALTLAVTACAEAEPPTLAAGSLVEALPASIWPAEPALVDEVECPALDVEVIAQATVCTATLDGDPVTVDVDIDDEGAASASVREPLFVVSDAADQLADRLAADLGIEPPTVDCGRQVVVPNAGLELSCGASRGASRDADTIDFTLRLIDAEGGWEIVLG